MREARTPITSASPTTLRSVWPRVAPSARTIPNSLTRWATVIENVLKMMNTPTKSATPAKVSRAGVRKPEMSPGDLLALGLGVLLGRSRPWPCCGQGRADPVGQLGGRHPVLRRGEDERGLALAVEPPLGVGEGGEHHGGAADRLHVAVTEDAHQRHRLRARLGREPDVGLADAQVLFVGGVLDDRHLARVLGQAALDRHVGVDRLVDVREDQRRSALGLDRSRRSPRAGRSPGSGPRRARRRRPRATCWIVDSGRGGELRPRSCRTSVWRETTASIFELPGLEDVVERRVDLVGQDEGARRPWPPRARWRRR